MGSNEPCHPAAIALIFQGRRSTRPPRLSKEHLRPPTRFLWFEKSHLCKFTNFQLPRPPLTQKSAASALPLQYTPFLVLPVLMYNVIYGRIPQHKDRPILQIWLSPPSYPRMRPPSRVGAAGPGIDAPGKRVGAGGRHREQVVRIAIKTGAYPKEKWVVDEHPGGSEDITPKRQRTRFRDAAIGMEPVASSQAVPQSHPFKSWPFETH
jgi:hypothetical protein